MSTEIAQLCKSIYNYKVSAICIFLTQEKHILSMAGKHTLGQPKLKVTL